MISDDTFRTELERIYKALGHRKSQRNTLIGLDLVGFSGEELESRDAYLESLEESVREAVRIKADAKKVPLEKDEQIEVVRWFKQTYPTKKIMMVRNDGFRLRKEKIEQMAMGLLPGASDLYIPHLHCWVEMKRADPKLSDWSDEQQAFCQYVSSFGDSYILAYGADMAIGMIQALSKENEA